MEKLKEQEQEFEDWKLVHQFYYGFNVYIKGWINKSNYDNVYIRNWEAMMEVVEKIESLGYYVMINRWTSIYTGKGTERNMIFNVENQSKIKNTYYACIGFIKWLNKNKKQ